MKKFIWFMILFLQFELSKAHWDDEFDEDTGLICRIIKLHAEEPRNTVEIRNHFRSKGRIETDRVLFIPLIPTHTKLFFEDLFDQEQTMKHYEVGQRRDLGYVTRRCTSWVNRWDESPFSWWALFDKENNNFIGGIGSFFHHDLSSIEIAYCLAPSAENRGYMTEALQEGFISYVKKSVQENNLYCKSIHATIDPENTKSIKLVTRIGMWHDKSKDYHSDSYNRPRCWYTLDLQGMYIADSL